MSTNPRLWRGPITDNQTNAGIQFDAVVATTSQDDYFAAWQDVNNFNLGHQSLVARHFDSSGNPLTGDVILDPLNNASNVPFNVVGPLAAVRLPIAGQHDGLAVAFADNLNNNNIEFDIYVVRTNANLQRLEAPLPIDVSFLNTTDPSITSFANGSLAVAYTKQTSATEWDIVGNIVSANGTVSAQFPIFTDNIHNDNVDLATLANGNFVAVLQAPLNPGDDDIGYEILNSSGTIVKGISAVAGAGDHPADETFPHVAALTGGGFAVTWTDSAGDSSAGGIRASVYDAAGNLVSGNILVNATDQAGDQDFTNVTGLNDGGFVITWNDTFAGGRQWVQRFDASGNMIGTAVDMGAGTTSSPNLATLSDGRFVSTRGGSGVFSSIWSTLSLPNDYTPNFLSDLVWRNDNGQLALWDMGNNGAITGSGFLTSGGQIITPPPTFSIAAFSDFSGDGASDLVWRDTSGNTALWIMNGSAIAGSASFTAGGAVVNPDPTWSIAAAGDFNGDGKSDLLWRNTSGTMALWTLNGSAITSSDFIRAGGVPVNPGPTFSIVGVGDFNADGRSDLIWRDSVTGEVAIWFLNGTSIVGSADLNAGGASVRPGPTWSIAGVGDFNGDGKADLLWRDSATSSLVVWEMNGSTIIGSGAITVDGTHPVSPGSDWHIVETGDFNGDNKTDILWRNDNGQLAEWLMNGGLITSSFVPNVNGVNISPDNTWHLQSKPNNYA